MLTANIVPNDGNYEKYYTATLFDAEVIARAKSLFDEYRSKGVILNYDFSDAEWKLTDQLRSTTISFQFNELKYHKNTKPWIGCEYDIFTDSAKAYSAFMLGSIAIGSIRGVVNNFRKIIELTETEILSAELEYPYHIAEFLAALPGENPKRDAMIEVLEEIQWDYPEQTGKNRQRVLAELGTYFRFNDAIQDFWGLTKDNEKLFWFPLYLWWTLTAVLPLRTTEFLLMPRKCLSVENGKSLITLRRTLLKKGGRKLAYRIDKDYETVRYVISDKMASEITWYIEATNAMTPSTLSTLFVREPHYAHFAKKPYTSLGYYTYINLSTCLRRFQDELMGVDAGSRIYLGDTRHLAMISLILSGGSPLICKELAGHSDINISSHYYSNISEFIKCATYEMHIKSRARTVALQEYGALAPGKREQSTPVEGGFCDSAIYGRGEIYDCVKCAGTDGEIGDCRFCPHFIEGTSGVHFLYAAPSERKEQVDRDSRYLLQAMEAVRRSIGFPEDIQSALLRLQQSGSWYGRSLQNEWEANGYGKAEKNHN